MLWFFGLCFNTIIYIQAGVRSTQWKCRLFPRSFQDNNKEKKVGRSNCTIPHNLPVNNTNCQHKPLGLPIFGITKCYNGIKQIYPREQFAFTFLRDSYG